MKRITIRSVAMAAGLGGVLTTSPGYSATTIDYSYDDLNRLTSGVRSDGPSFSYSYDEVGNITVIATTNPDTDGDGLTDLEEINIYLTDPYRSDTDLDGLGDGEEVLVYGTGPLLADTDGDGVSDGDEVAAGTDPLNPVSFPVYADGDLNMDGVVDVADLILAERIILGELMPTQDQLRRGDVAPVVNGVSVPNGVFDLGDLIVIRWKVMRGIAE